MTYFNPLDPFIAPHIRSAIEQRYYARINAQAQLQQALKDPLFLQNPSAHVALFADLAWCMCAMWRSKFCKCWKPFMAC